MQQKHLAGEAPRAQQRMQAPSRPPLPPRFGIHVSSFLASREADPYVMEFKQ
jgi:hypothetical protein